MVRVPQSFFIWEFPPEGGGGISAILKKPRDEERELEEIGKCLPANCLRDPTQCLGLICHTPACSTDFSQVTDVRFLSQEW